MTLAVDREGAVGVHYCYRELYGLMFADDVMLLGLELTDLSYRFSSFVIHAYSHIRLCIKLMHPLLNINSLFVRS